MVAFLKKNIETAEELWTCAVFHRKLISASWQWFDRNPSQLHWISGAQLIHNYLKCLNVQALLLCFHTAHSPIYLTSIVLFWSIWMVLLPSLLSVTLNISVFLTAYPTSRSTFLLYSSYLSAPLHTFMSFIHPSREVCLSSTTGISLLCRSLWDCPYTHPD